MVVNFAGEVGLKIEFSTREKSSHQSLVDAEADDLFDDILADGALFTGHGCAGHGD